MGRLRDDRANEDGPEDDERTRWRGAELWAHPKEADLVSISHLPRARLRGLGLLARRLTVFRTPSASA